MTIPTDMESVYALLTVMADPKAAKARLDELASTHQKQIDELSGMYERANTATATAERVKSDAYDQCKTTEATLMAHRLEVTRFKQDMDAYQKERAAQKLKFDARQKELEDMLATANAEHVRVSVREKDLDIREEKIKQIEDQIATHEAAAYQSRVGAEALRKTYEDRIAALRHAMA
jgi:chromosome segregation ATPase